MFENNQDKSSSQGVRILRYPAVVRKTGISRSGISARIRAGEFPRPVSLGPRAVGFVEGEIDSYLADLINNRQEVAA